MKSYYFFFGRMRLVGFDSSGSRCRSTVDELEVLQVALRMVNFVICVFMAEVMHLVLVVLHCHVTLRKQLRLRHHF